MQIRRYWVTLLILLCSSGESLAAELFESASTPQPNSKMDIVIKEVDRRERSSILDLKITNIGSSVGSSFFIVCSISRLAQIRGDYRYVVKLDQTPKQGQMTIGFLRSATEDPAALGRGFENLGTKDVLDLEQFAPICSNFK
ncbi:MAG TPA: hypothetical protein VL381_08770 [Rhodocyclaceae bacterium]|nr:hypothetical protein [Rhodocyclaceae bacterium]